MNELVRFACAVVFVLALIPSEARAAWVGKSGDHLYYNAAAGELNTVRVTLQPNGDIRFTDGGASPLYAEGGCSLPGTSAADCPSVGITHIKVRLEDRDDLAIIDVGLRAFVWGHDGADTILGSAGNDELYGGWGGDVLAGRAGSDLMDAGDNDGDTASYLTHTAAVYVGIDQGAGSGGVTGESDTLRGIKNLVGGMGNDTLVGDDRRNRIEGGDGADFLYGGERGDTLIGGSGNDTLVEGWRWGGGGDDMFGGADNDTIDYSAGLQGWSINSSEIVFEASPPWSGGSEDDDLPDPKPPSSFGPIEVTLDDQRNDGVVGTWDGQPRRGGDNAHSDIEVVYGSPGVDELIGSAANNLLEGNGGPDRLVGGGGSDHLVGGESQDVLIGDNGNDTLDGGAGGDVLLGGDDFDTVSYAGRNAGVVVTVGSGADDGEPNEGDDVHVERVVGTAYADVLTGDDGAETLQGLGGFDRITGADGTDRLEGGTGNDTIEADDRKQDSVDCGPDVDVANIDQFDPPVLDCEQTNDVVPPSVVCESGTSEWTLGPVTIQCSAIDWESGPAFPETFTLTATGQADQESANTTTNTVVVCDQALNCTSVTRAFKIDRKGPAIFPVVPAQDEHVILNQTVVPSVTCTDGGSGVKRCGGIPFPPAMLDTSTVGAGKKVRATGKDWLENHSDLYVTYSVGYALCNVQTGIGHGTAEVFFSLCDANGVNVSDPAIAIQNAQVDSQEQEKEPITSQYEERKQSGYLIEIPLNGLESGPHRLTFTAGNDPALHAVDFDVP